MAAAPRSNQQHRRLVRTIVLGTLAVAAGIYWLAGELGMDKQELLNFARTSALLVGAAVLLALLGAGLLRALKKLLGRD
jgi:hypothetical protein